MSDHVCETCSEDTETVEAAHPGCGNATGAARYADAVATQAQALEQDPGVYRAFVSATAAQTRDANPNLLVPSSLSTSLGYLAAAETFLAAWKAVDGIVDSHDLPLAKLRHQEVAAASLRMVEALHPQAGR